MTREEKVKAEALRIKLVKKWPARLKRLIARKKKKGVHYSEAQFCRDHSIPKSGFNRGKNLERIPNEETVAAVEKALQSECV